jgi:hypothetical protein
MDIVYKGPRTLTNGFSTNKTGRLMSDFMIIQTVYALINTVISSSANIQAAVKKSIPHSVLPCTL